MNKIILKTALVTVASLTLAALLVFGLWILISPQTMAASCERTGNYSFAVTCADMRYKRTGDIYDLARCAQDSISAKKYKLIVKYCEKLVSDDGFDGLCAVKDEQVADTKYGEYATGYKGYICGNLSAAQYRAGNLDAAIKTAESGASFSKLAIAVIETGTKDDARKVLQALDSSYEGLTALLNEFIYGGD